MTKKINFEKISYYSLLLFAFFIPLSRASNSFFVFWLGVLALIALKNDFTKTWNKIKSNQIFIYIFLFIGYMAFSIFWSKDIPLGINQLRLLSYWLLIPAIYILIKKEWLYPTLNSFLMGMLISEILAYGIYFDLWSIHGRTPDYPSPFMTHIHYSVFLAFTSLVLLYRLLYEHLSLKIKVLMLIFFLSSTTNLMISTGRTGQLAFFITLFVVIFIKYRINLKSFFATVVFSLIIAYTSYYTLPLFQKRVNAAVEDIQLILTHNYNSSFGIRTVWWIVTWDALKEKPIFGYGLGAYKDTAKIMDKKYQYEGLNETMRYNLKTKHYHNQYLMTIVQGGLVGLFLMFLLFYKLYSLQIRDKELKHLSIIAITVFLVAFIGEPLWLLQFPLILFIFLISIFIGASKNDD